MTGEHQQVHPERAQALQEAFGILSRGAQKIGREFEPYPADPCVQSAPRTA
jgi:hypothetical protein